MTSIVRFVLLALALITSAWAFYVRSHKEIRGTIYYYFSEAEIEVNRDVYVQACDRLPGFFATPVFVASQSMQDLLFSSYSGNESYLIGSFGPHTDGAFKSFSWIEMKYHNFENKTAARKGVYGIAYIDFPSNRWRVAPLMSPQRMRYICRVVSPCNRAAISKPCGSFGRAQCMFNHTSGWYNCVTNATSCEDGVSCINGGTCVNQADGHYRCLCSGGHTGEHCEYFDACQSNPCENNGTCVSKLHQALCQCTDDYYGDRCQHRVDRCHNSACDPYPCIESSQSHYCLCPVLGAQMCVSSRLTAACWADPRFELTAKFINQVAQFVRPYVNINGSMACGCDDDVTLDNNNNTTTCAYDVNECASNPCLYDGKCVDKTNGYKCDCRGTKHTGDRCQYRYGDCKPNMCLNGGACVHTECPTESIEICHCEAGFTGEFCESDVDECASNPCRHNGKCRNRRNRYKCKCGGTGYYGQRCQREIDECSSNPCGAGQCTDFVNAFECNCNSTGFVGEQCEINIDDCVQHSCRHNGTCIDQINGYTCNCTDTGYDGAFCDVNIDHCPKDEEGQICAEDIDECESDPCVHGSCMDELLGYECNCSDTGHYGSRCELQIDECGSNPCRHGNCTDSIGHYTCACFTGYDGEQCDVIVGKPAESSNSIHQLGHLALYAVFGAAILISVVVLTVFSIRRSQRQKSEKRRSDFEVSSAYTALRLQQRSGSFEAANVSVYGSPECTEVRQRGVGVRKPRVY